MDAKEEIAPKGDLLGDPLSPVTRRERRNLLATSGVGIVMAKAALIPSKIAALGIEFTDASQAAIRISVAVLIIYFGCAFALYGSSDFVAWRLALHARARDGFRRYQLKQREPKDQEFFPIAEPPLYPTEHALYWVGGPLSVVRAIFEFALPMVVGAYAVRALLLAH